MSKDLTRAHKIKYGLSLDNSCIFDDITDPTSGAGYVAPEGSLYLRYGVPNNFLYHKTGIGDTDWKRILNTDDVKIATDSVIGIASFNSDNLVVTSGSVNTIQNIGTGDTLTFNDVFLGVLNRNFYDYGSDTKLFTGIPITERGKFKISFTYSGGNITATISFVGSNTSFSYYINGKKFIVTSTELSAYTKTVSSAEGLWFFYIHSGTTDVSTPIMSLTQTPWSIFSPDVLLWDAYFNATANTFTWIGEERHTAGRDIYQHARNHAQGAVYKTGFLLSALNGLTNFSGDTQNNYGRAQFQISGGSFYDEDILNNIVHSGSALTSTVTNPSTDWNLTVNQFLGFTATAQSGTNSTTIVFPSSRTLITGQTLIVMTGNSTTIRGSCTVTTGGTGTNFTVSSVTGLSVGDVIVSNARIPIYYLSNSTTWRRLTTTDFLAVMSGASATTSNIASGVAQYNDSINGGFLSVTANRYYPVYLIATNSITEPIIAILGQGQSTNGTLATALSEIPFQFSNLSGLSSLSFQEMVPFYRLTFIYNTTASFSNTRVKLADATFLNVRVATVSGSVLGSGTSSLSASQIFTDTSLWSGLLTTSETNVQSALNKIDSYINQALLTTSVTTFASTTFTDKIGIGLAPVGYGLEMTAIDATNWAKSFLSVTRYDVAGGNANPVILFRRGKGTSSSPADTVSGDYLGQFQFYGIYSGAFKELVEFSGVHDGTQGGKFIIASCDSTSGTMTERFNVNGSGLMSIFGNVELVGASASIKATNGTNASLLLDGKGTGGVLINRSSFFNTLSALSGTTGTLNIDWSASNLFTLNGDNAITGNITLTFSNAVKGSIILKIKHSTAGNNYTVTFPSSYHIGQDGASAKVYTLNGSATARYTWYMIAYDGSNYYVIENPFHA